MSTATESHPPLILSDRMLEAINLGLKTQHRIPVIPQPNKSTSARRMAMPVRPGLVMWAWPASITIIPKHRHRTWLLVTRAWTERLHDVSPVDMLLDGVIQRSPKDNNIVYISSYVNAWDSVCMPKDLKWAANPLVSCLEFRLIGPPNEPHS